MKKTICIILIAAFAALFCTSAYFIFDHYRQEEQQAELYDSLADMVDSAAETEWSVYGQMASHWRTAPAGNLV